jgi:uncharacterized integral membrane protein
MVAIEPRPMVASLYIDLVPEFLSCHNFLMEDPNPYLSPVIPQVSTEVKVQPEYPSRTKAIAAGFWRGAKFGGKWMAIILIFLSILLWIFFAAAFLYFWLYKGADFRLLANKLEPLKMLGITIGTILYISFLSAIVGALIMGAAAGISYRKSSRKKVNCARHSERMLST